MKNYKVKKVVKKNVTQKQVFNFLDMLRNSGITNMFGATPYIMEVYPELTKEEARKHLSEWMRTFQSRQEAM